MTAPAVVAFRAVGAVLGGIAAALVVEVLLVVAGLRLPDLEALVASAAVVVGVPAATYLVVMVLLARRGRVPPVAGLLAGLAGLAGLYRLGGYVLMVTACGIAPSGGC